MRNCCLLVSIQGRVQGVSFRYYTRNKARELGIHGWVRNLSDGSVEVCICGEAEQIKTMRQWLKHGPIHASVSGIDFKNHNPANRQSGFHIL